MKKILWLLFLLVGWEYACAMDNFKPIARRGVVTKREKQEALRCLRLKESVAAIELSVLNAYQKKMSGDWDQLSYINFSACHTLLAAQYESLFKCGQEYGASELIKAHKEYAVEVDSMEGVSAAIKDYQRSYGLRAFLYLRQRIDGKFWGLKTLYDLVCESERRLGTYLVPLVCDHDNSIGLRDLEKRGAGRLDTKEYFITTLAGLRITTICQPE